MRGQLVVVPILALLLLFTVPWWTLVLAPDWGTAATIAGQRCPSPTLLMPTTPPCSCSTASSSPSSEASPGSRPASDVR